MKMTGCIGDDDGNVDDGDHDDHDRDDSEASDVVMISSVQTQDDSVTRGGVSCLSVYVLKCSRTFRMPLLVSMCSRMPWPMSCMP